MKIHYQDSGRWLSQVVLDLDAAEAAALMVCREAIKRRDQIVVLIEERGSCERAMLTFGDDADEPYIAYRGFKILSVVDAKRGTDANTIDFDEPLGNFEV